MEHTSIVSLRNINVNFDGEVILNNIDLDIRDKEFITLLGPSGCGKTTTLRIIGGFLEPDSGDVFYEGKRINGTPPNKRNINTVFQKYALFPHLNVFDNVAFGLKLKKLPKDEIKKLVTKMLAIVDLKGYEKRSVSKLSGGQQQRVAIARALVCDPDVLLLDEPLGALDLKLRKDMQIELKRIQKMTKKTFVYVTHDQEEALTMSDRVVVMKNGKIEQIGSPIDIYNEPANAFVADFIGEANILDGVMLKDYKVRILGSYFPCVDKGFGENTPVDIVIRPEDIEITSPEEGTITGDVTSVVFKGVHYEMEVRTQNCIFLIHSTVSSSVGSHIGMRVDPNNIHIMHKLFPTAYNQITAEVTYCDEEENSVTVEIEGHEVEIPGYTFEKGTQLNIILPPDGLHVDGEGIGQLPDVYIESVIWKGMHNEIILESDECKWIMHSLQDEQVATYVPICFDFSKAQIVPMAPQEGANEN